ncbi:MAG: tryptophan--tRNA ligase [Patescibacteria group bacterium]
MDEKQTVFSGIQPSGNLHLGNYLGAITQWVEMQEQYRCIFCVVDYHAITVKQDPAVLKKKIKEITKIYLASGIDPDRSVIFKQSDISAHTELAWVLNCASARISDLDKMTQFKDKAQKGGKEKASVGLYDYPVLMAADILLYNTDVVPVGEDQVQHVELARTLARRFNNRFEETFKVPSIKIKEAAARIMALDEPEKKMSKSAASSLNYITLTDDPEAAGKKIMKAVTDTDSDIKYDKKDKPGISNLLGIYSSLTDKTVKQLEKNYKGKGYGEFKKDLAEVVRDFLGGFQKKYNNINDKDVEKVLAQGRKKVEPVAKETLERVKKRIGVN